MFFPTSISRASASLSDRVAYFPQDGESDRLLKLNVVPSKGVSTFRSLSEAEAREIKVEK